MGGLFFIFEAFRTKSRPRRSTPSDRTSSRRWRGSATPSRRQHCVARRWGETPDVANLATALAGKLQVVGWGASDDLKDLLALDRTPRDASTNERRRAVSELLREMNTNLPLVTVVAPQDELQVAAKGAKKVEPIYKTPYFAEKLSSTVASSQIKFPPVNPYIPDTDPNRSTPKKLNLL